MSNTDSEFKGLKDLLNDHEIKCETFSIKSSALYYMTIGFEHGLITVKSGPSTLGWSLGYLEVFCKERMLIPIGYLSAYEAFELILNLISGEGFLSE